MECDNCGTEMQFKFKNVTIGETLYKCPVCGKRVQVKDIENTKD